MTIKKFISMTLLAGVLGLTTYLGYRIIRIQKIRSDASRLPSFAFKTTTGKTFTDDMIKPGYSHLVINHFSPDCEFCQHMTIQLRDKRQWLDNTLVIMVTESDSTEVAGFMTKYRLNDREDILVLLDPTVTFYRKFGTGVAPSFFVYDGSRRLTKRILGETKIEDLIQ